MAPKIKNIILFVGIGIALVAVYFLFIKKAPEQASLTTTSTTGVTTSANAPVGGVQKEDSQIAKDFLGLLLSVKGITLDDSIFSDVAFSHLKDSSILLVQEGNEGRPNPFAPIGSDVPDSVSASDLGASATTGINTPLPESALIPSKITTPVKTTNPATNTFVPNSLNTGSSNTR